MGFLNWPIKTFILKIWWRRVYNSCIFVDTPPVITIDNYQLEVVHEFTYLGSTITDNLSLDAELNKRIGKAAMTLGSSHSSLGEPQADYQNQDGCL